MTAELTEIGFLSLIAFIGAVLAGGQITGGGISVSATIPVQGQAHVYVTPIAITQITSSLGQRGLHMIGGLTLGGTVMLLELHPLTQGEGGREQRWRVPRHLMEYLERYELGHVPGWTHYGLDYFIKVFTEACRYDPKAPWAVPRCPNQDRPAFLLTPRTGSIRFSWEK